MNEGFSRPIHLPRLWHGGLRLCSWSTEGERGEGILKACERETCSMVGGGGVGVGKVKTGGKW